MELIGSPEQVAQLQQQARDLPSWDLSARQTCDVELLLNGGFAPLRGFLTRADYESVVTRMRLSDGTLWPIPIVLDVTPEFAGKAAAGRRIALRDPEGVLLAVMDVSDAWTPDRAAEAAQVYGTTDNEHPGVRALMEDTRPLYLGGRLHGVSLPLHFDFNELRLTPRELRETLRRRGWQRVVAFQTRNPMHRAHVELALRAARDADANLLIHPVAGMTRPGDIDHYARVRCYEHVLKHLPDQVTALALLPLAMRMAGPREALWHALIRRNHGCTHFIVGRDHAGPGKDASGKDFYAPYAAQELCLKHKAELGIRILPYPEMLYVEERAQYVPADQVGAGERVLRISGTEFRRRLREGLAVPEWFSYREVLEELRRTIPPRHRQGVTVFFTGLSGAGKSTIARALLARLMETGQRSVSLLDGDIVRKHLSSELGFSRAHRDLNIQRIGFVAAEISKHGGIALCAPIAPYAATRRKVREMISEHAGFIEVYVSTPLETCEARDRKGLYAKARAGLIPEFTGISDPYEVPLKPELTIDTRNCTPLEAAQTILRRLELEGYIR